MALRTRTEGMDMQLPEPPAEILVLVQRHLLVAEEDHLMAHQRIVDFGELVVAHRLSEIDAVDFRPDGRRQRMNFYGLISHGGRSPTTSIARR